jgi:GTP-binding protein HflX
MKEQFIDRHKGGERAILVQMTQYLDTPPDALEEFQELATTAGVRILEVIGGNLASPSPKYFVGSGKAEEILEAVKSLNADVVIFNHELAPAQGRNLETLFECLVLDRTELILDIFAQRARTHEGKLQVELAQLQHMRTRLVRGWTHLERQKGGIGLRGPGETQLESDRRMVDVKIKRVSKRLEKVAEQREQSRRARKRQELPVISLVGYTNAGKSSLFNALTESAVYVANKLFATLDPTLRQVHFPKVGSVVLADTVGFIRELPHDLVAAFRSTLEETRQADLLLHVVDCSKDDLSSLINSVHLVLDEIGANDVRQLMVMNKIDLIPNCQPRIDRDESGVPVAVWLSAAQQTGFNLLAQAISELVAELLIHCKINLPSNEGKLRSLLYDLNAVIEEKIDEDGNWILELELKQADFDRLLG